MGAGPGPPRFGGFGGPTGGGEGPLRQGSSASVPGKAILFGEHAVVYGRPAIAMPLHELRLTARLAGPGEPELDEAVRVAWRLLERSGDPPPVRIESSLPIGAGLGSSAALSVALVRLLGPPHLEAESVAALAHELERLYHGTPSGLDTTVVALERAVWFQRGQPPEPLQPGRRLRFLLVDSGRRASTAGVVGEVRERAQAEPAVCKALFDSIGWIAREGRRLLTEGDGPALGRLMVENQRLLQSLGVSSPELDGLVEGALQAGAWGAKLSGAGRGGHVLVLAPLGVELEGARETWLEA